MRRPARWLLLALYLGSYLPLTVAGVYVVANHGGSDWRREWLPRFVVTSYQASSGRFRTALTPVGTFYLPCLIADRLLWHNTQYDDLFEAPTATAP